MPKTSTEVAASTAAKPDNDKRLSMCFSPFALRQPRYPSWGFKARRQYTFGVHRSRHVSAVLLG
jgi:hypothetical protein